MINNNNNDNNNNNIIFYNDKKIYEDYNCFIKKCNGLNSNSAHYFIKSRNSLNQYCKYCGCPFFQIPITMESFFQITPIIKHPDEPSKILPEIMRKLPISGGACTRLHSNT